MLAIFFVIVGFSNGRNFLPGLFIKMHLNVFENPFDMSGYPMREPSAGNQGETK